MTSKRFAAQKTRNLVLACGVALALTVIVPALADSQAGPLYVYDSADPYAIEGSTSASNGIGVEGYAAVASLNGVTGVLGYTKSQYSTGVTGYSDGSGQSYGVNGYSANGNGVFGNSLSSSAASIYGSNSNGGTAVYGLSTALALLGTSTGTNGVVGTTQTSATQKSWAGVLGTDNSTAGAHYGVAGKSASHDGYGVYGMSVSGNAVVGGALGYGQGAFVGVYGVSIGGGDGVVGMAGPRGSAVGVQGGGINLVNRNGVIGQTSSGFGVEGIASGTQGYGVLGVGLSSGSSGNGVLAESDDATASALRLYAYDGRAIDVHSYTGLMSLDADGNMILKGTLTQSGTPRSVIRNPQGAGRVVYALQQSQPTLEDVGDGQMVAGRAYVRFDPAFAELLDRSASYQVFLMPKGPTTEPLYVTQESHTGFAVREASGRATLAFDYRIVARPASARRLSRLALFHDPLAVRRKKHVLPPIPIDVPNRDVLTRDITVGPAPKRLKVPFVPKPTQRR